MTANLPEGYVPPPAKPHYTLEDFNAQQMQMYERLAAARKAHPNNIACPICKAELWDMTPLVALTINPQAIDPANPPYQGIECKACGWAGTRLA